MLRFSKLMALAGLLIMPFFSQADDKNFLQTAELKCVADGVEIATGPGGKIGLRPSEKYIALLGFAVQRNYKSVNSAKGGDDRRLYLERVIQMLQADGFCIANQLDGGGVPTAQVGYGDIVSDKSNKAAPYLIYAVAGLRSKEQKDGNTQSALDSTQMREVIKYFGFKDESDIQNIFKDDSWSSLNPDQRQKLLSENVENDMYANNEYGDGLKDCFNQMKLMRNRDTIFNFKGVKDGRRSDSRKFCETVAKECKLESTTFCSVSAPTFKKDAGTDSSSGSGQSIFDSVKGAK